MGKNCCREDFNDERECETGLANVNSKLISSHAVYGSSVTFRRRSRRFM